MENKASEYLAQALQLSERVKNSPLREDLLELFVNRIYEMMDTAVGDVVLAELMYLEEFQPAIKKIMKKELLTRGIKI